MEFWSIAYCSNYNLTCNIKLRCFSLLWTLTLQVLKSKIFCEKRENTVAAAPSQYKDRLIYVWCNMGIAIPGKTVFLIETAPWLLVLPYHEQPGYWLCKMNRPSSSMRNDFSVMSQLSDMNMEIWFHFFSQKFNTLWVNKTTRGKLASVRCFVS